MLWQKAGQLPYRLSSQSPLARWERPTAPLKRGARPRPVAKMLFVVSACRVAQPNGRLLVSVITPRTLFELLLPSFRAQLVVALRGTRASGHVHYDEGIAVFSRGHSSSSGRRTSGASCKCARFRPSRYLRPLPPFVSFPSPVSPSSCTVPAASFQP